MNLTRWVGKRLSAETRLGEGARRVYRRFSPRRVRLWTEVLHGLAAGSNDVRFVQVGSNDAGYGDPLRYHIRNNGWRGLMIEPLPHVFRRLQARYGAVSGLILENVAIDREPGVRPFYHLRPSDEPGLPVWYDMLGSFLKENVLAHSHLLPDIPERIMETPVRCLTFDQACGRHGIEAFDVLHIDAEGYDYEILRSVDLARYRPAVLLYENMHLSSEDYAASLDRLHSADMLTHSDKVDTIAVARQALETNRPLARSWRFLRRRVGVPESATHSGTQGKRR